MFKKIETGMETFIFASRWLLAPLYVGLVFALLALVVMFFKELLHMFGDLGGLEPEKIILGVLSLIDLSLAGNLVIIVLFSGYENFVSKMDISHPDKPSWMGKIDFAGLKLKLVASIVAISAIQLLKAFMNSSQLNPQYLMWLVIIHLSFVVSGVLLALMDLMSAKALKIEHDIKH